MEISKNDISDFSHNIDLLISADCVPFTYANFHSKFLKGKVLMMLCPKLDSDIDSYIEKLANIFKTKNIKIPQNKKIELIIEFNNNNYINFYLEKELILVTKKLSDIIY